MKPTTRLTLAAIWLALLVGAAFLVSQRLQLSGDLRKFMPGRDGKKRTVPSKAARAACARQTKTRHAHTSALREVYA